MGGCYSIHHLLQNDNINECLICFESINLTNDYVKCKKCKILLHFKCATTYKSLQRCRSSNCNKLKCPHCQRCNTSYLYTCNNIYKF